MTVEATNRLTLIERLRDMADPKIVGSHFHPLYGEAANEIERLRNLAPAGQTETHPSIAWLAAEISEKASLMMHGTTSYL